MSRHIFRIINRKTGNIENVRFHGTDFDSPESARSSNCHGLYLDKTRYAIIEVVVTEQVINSDVDGSDMPEEWHKKEAEHAKIDKRVKKILAKNPNLNPFNVAMDECFRKAFLNLGKTIVLTQKWKK